MWCLQVFLQGPCDTRKKLATIKRQNHERSGSAAFPNASPGKSQKRTKVEESLLLRRDGDVQMDPRRRQSLRSQTVQHQSADLLSPPPVAAQMAAAAAAVGGSVAFIRRKVQLSRRGVRDPVGGKKPRILRSWSGDSAPCWPSASPPHKPLPLRDQSVTSET